MNVKYQIFISSTYEDLREEREQVIKATLEMGHIPVGMEMFSAADEEQWKLIKRQIDECDYYAVLIAHRYGSTVEDVSYTEKEYDYAASKGIPVIGFIIENEASWPTSKVDKDEDAIVALNKFKDKVRLKLVSTWKSADDIYGKYSIALMKLISSNPRPGWTRATELADPSVLNEISRLSSENAELRTTLDVALIKLKEDAAANIDKIIDTLKNNTVRLWIYYRDGKDWVEEGTVVLLDVFESLAPELMIESSTKNSATNLAVDLKADNQKTQRAEWPVPSNHVKSWLSDLAALGLVTASTQKHSLKDEEQYWTLTEWGRKVHSTMRRRKLEAGIPTTIPEKKGKKGAK